MAAGTTHAVSLAALIAIRPGRQARLIFRTHRARRGDKRKGFTGQDCARFLDAAHQQLGGPLVLVWDGLNTHASQPGLLEGFLAKPRLDLTPLQ